MYMNLNQDANAKSLIMELDYANILQSSRGEVSKSIKRKRSRERGNRVEEEVDKGEIVNVATNLAPKLVFVDIDNLILRTSNK